MHRLKIEYNCNVKIALFSQKTEQFFWRNAYLSTLLRTDSTRFLCYTEEKYNRHIGYITKRKEECSDAENSG